jgi:acyl-coenzyme A thioesterase PaaI-like protein
MGEIIAEAVVIHLGKRTITVQCQVSQEQVLIASVTGTFAILTAQEVGEIKRQQSLP